MKRKGLYFLIALALGGVGAVHAQDTMAPDSQTGNSASDAAVPSFDGRWYIAPTVGGYYNDTDRNTNSRQIYYGLGLGKFVNPNISLDLFIDRTKRERDRGAAAGGGHSSVQNWSNNTTGVAARFYGGSWNSWRPYMLAGIMGSFHNNSSDNGWAPAAELGGGLSKTVTDSSDVRLEAGYRYDWDKKSQRSESGYGDWFLGLSIVARLGSLPPPPLPPPAAPPPAAPVAPAPVEEPDTLPEHAVIDLRGLNFKFDRPKTGETDISKSLAVPTSDSMSILEQAVDTLQRYPDVHVTVAGYTDAIGTDAYNQKLSERRASIVYDYLTSHGIDSSRLEGPIGHGETNPIGDNSTDSGRAQNRRTELQTQQ